MARSVLCFCLEVGLIYQATKHQRPTNLRSDINVDPNSSRLVMNKACDDQSQHLQPDVDASRIFRKFEFVWRHQILKIQWTWPIKSLMNTV